MTEDIKVSESAQAVIDSVEKMTVMELNDLVKAFEEKFGVTAAAPVAVAAAPAAGAADDAGASATVSVILTAAGEKKIQVLKVVRELLGLGLKEAKELVDGVPKALKEGIKQEDADEIKQKIEAEGGQVEVK